MIGLFTGMSMLSLCEFFFWMAKTLLTSPVAKKHNLLKRRRNTKKMLPSFS